MTILEILAVGLCQDTSVTRYHLKVIIICSSFCSCAFCQSEIC